MFLRGCVRLRKHLIPTTIRRAVPKLHRRTTRWTNQSVSDRFRRSPSVHGAELLLTVHRCSRLVSYRRATCGIAPCDEIDCPACAHMRLQRQVPVAAVPTKDLCLDSNDFVHRACDGCPRLYRHCPMISMDDLSMHLCGKARGNRPVRDVSPI